MEKPRIHFEVWRDNVSDAVFGFRPSPSIAAEYIRLAIDRSDSYVSMTLAGERVEEIGSIFHKGMHSYIKSGCQSFSLGENLIDMFTNTSLKNVQSDDIKLPYDGFYIALPRGTMRIWGGRRTGYHDVMGLYVFRIITHGRGPGFTVFACGEANKHSVAPDDDACSYVAMSFDEISCEGSAERALDAMLRESLATTAPYMYEDGSDLSEERGIALREARHRMREQDNRNKFRELAELTNTPSYMPEGLPPRSVESMKMENAKNTVKMMRIALNTMLYLNSPKREITRDEQSFSHMAAIETLTGRFIEDRGKQSKMERLATKISKKRATHLHYIAPTLEADMSEPGEGSKRQRHWVRGFWNFYWCGKGRWRREPRWLMPRLRGEGDEPEETRHYEVQE